MTTFDDDLTVTDGFCGAGGSTQGAHAVPGVRVVIAMNHWKLAVDTHAENFPDTAHDIANISQADPRRYPRTRVLWMSPECTNHSQAKGKKAVEITPDMFGDILPDEAAERSRATMWDVPRFAEYHRYDAVIVENVVDVAKWVMFPAWLQAMTLLGYEHQIVCLNSMHAQAAVAPRAPQSRDRLYIVFHRKGATKPAVTPHPLAWCAGCSLEVDAIQVWKRPDNPVGRYRQQYTYQCPRCVRAVEPYALAAASAIDWSMPGLRIGDRAKPLSVKTIARIEAGLRRYGPDAYLTINRDGQRNVPIASPVPTIVASPNAIGLIVPSGGTWNEDARSTDEPMTTRTTREMDALVVPVEGRENLSARSVNEPGRTQTARLQDALVVPYYSRSEAAYPATQPMQTMTSVDSAGIAFIAELRGGHSTARDVQQPLCTVTAAGNHHMLVRHNSLRSGPGGEMCTPVTEPARTITTKGHQSLVSIEQQVDDCTFRMLEPHEIQAAMAFHGDYRVLGNRRERVRQLGNAVTPPAAEFLIRAVAEALGGAA